jgi:short-subunit dehydrogenase
MTKNILITGHSKGLGRSILENLLSNTSFKITGISRTSSGIQNPNLQEISADLSNPEQTKKLQSIFSSQNFDVVILNAGANNIKPPESYTLEEIEKIIHLNFTANALIIKMCLNGLLKNKGHIIGIGSYSGIEIKKWNNFYGSSKAALHHLLRNLFEQYRKQDLKVSIVIPDIMHSSFYENREYQSIEDTEYSLQVKDVAKIISDWIIQPPAYVPLEIVLRPQKFQLKRNE